jgi:thioredoxin-like negative regulator of GroEL
LHPLLDDVALDYAGRLKVVKLNIDDNQRTPASYGIRGIPTLMLFQERQHRSHQGRRPLEIAADQLH